LRKGFINGCFDVLHPGHIAILEYSKSLCDHLIVALDSDERVATAKGNDRPFNNLDDRKRVMQSIRYVDEVVTFSSTEGLERLIKNCSPDVLIVGSDWEGKTVIGAEHAKELKYFRRIDGHSTTRILESSLNRR
jgi:D-beta-D-heptose 7-phosphate kinase/D-beta-D-heptose 1-phosphate adenosyltransferase